MTWTIGGDLAPSLGGRKKIFAAQIFEWPFLGKNFHFNAENFWWLFLVIDHKFRIPPILPVLVHFPPDSRKLLFLPYFSTFPPCFRKIHQLFTYFMCISPLLWPWCIYASPNARTGRPWVQGVWKTIPIWGANISKARASGYSSPHAPNNLGRERLRMTEWRFINVLRPCIKMYLTL